MKPIMKLKIRFTSIVLIIVTVIAVMGMISGRRMNYITYSESLNKVAVTVDGVQLTLQDAAFYVVYQENLVERQALDYNPQNTARYWNIHMSGKFVRTEAKQTAMDQMIHDEVFFRLSQQEGIELTEEEERYLANEQQDFWDDYGEKSSGVLGVTRDILDESMYKIAVAEKYQALMAAAESQDIEEYSISGEAYQELLKDHTYKINEDLWGRVHFGSITVPH